MIGSPLTGRVRSALSVPTSCKVLVLLLVPVLPVSWPGSSEWAWTRRAAGRSERQGWVVPSGGVADGVAGDGWCWGVEQGLVAGVEGRGGVDDQAGPGSDGVDDVA